MTQNELSPTLWEILFKILPTLTDITNVPKHVKLLKNITVRPTDFQNLFPVYLSQTSLFPYSQVQKCIFWDLSKILTLLSSTESSSVTHPPFLGSKLSGNPYIVLKLNNHFLPVLLEPENLRLKDTFLVSVLMLAFLLRRAIPKWMPGTLQHSINVR